MISDYLGAGLALVAGLAYIIRLESHNALQDQALLQLEKLVDIHLKNIDRRLARIEQKVLNGHD
jgi:hypothetical protein